MWRKSAKTWTLVASTGADFRDGKMNTNVDVTRANTFAPEHFLASPAIATRLQAEHLLRERAKFTANGPTDCYRIGRMQARPRWC